MPIDILLFGKSYPNQQRKDKKAVGGYLELRTKRTTEEDNMPTPSDFTTIDTEKVQSTVDKLNEDLKPKKDIDTNVRTKL